MKQSDGTLAAICVAFSLAGIAIATLIYVSTPSGQIDYVSRQSPRSDDAAEYCDRKFRPLRTSPSSNRDGAKDQQKPDDWDAYCQQARAADAAEVQAYWTWAQSIVSGAGLALVLLATYFAWRAAYHTKRQADTADAAYKNLERPYLFVELDEHVVGSGGETAYLRSDAWVEIAFRNHGRTPAVPISAAIEFEIFASFNESVPIIPTHIFDGSVLAPSKRTDSFLRAMRPHIAEGTYARIESGELSIWLYGVIHYAGPFGTPHRTEFCWKYDGPAKRFGPYLSRYNKRE